MITLSGCLLFSCLLLSVHYLEKEKKKNTEDVSSCDDSFNFDLPFAETQTDKHIHKTAIL